MEVIKEDCNFTIILSNRLMTNHSTALKIDIDYSVIQYFDLCKKVSF